MEYKLSERKTGLTCWIVKRKYIQNIDYWKYTIDIKTEIRNKTIEKEVQLIPAYYKKTQKESIKTANECFENNEIASLYYVIDTYKKENRIIQKNYFALKNQNEFVIMDFKKNPDKSIVDYTARRMIHLNEIIMEEIK